MEDTTELLEAAAAFGAFVADAATVAKGDPLGSTKVSAAPSSRRGDAARGRREAGATLSWNHFRALDLLVANRER